MTAHARDDFGALFLNQVPLLDVRAPVEFARGAFPGALNLPLLTDEERHAVGIRYKEAGQDEAIALGAQLITPDQRAQRTQAWSTFATQHPAGALYCFRGGLRSRIAQQWLAEAGHALPRIAGGYKAMRRFLIDSLEERLARLPVMVIGGRTGVGKTLMIRALDRAVDLEALACHRGSSFGRLITPQPSNIDFENAVSIALLHQCAQGGGPVYFEDEARLIGRVCLPDVLRNTLERSPAIVLEATMEQRIDNAVADYVVDLLQRYQQTHNSKGEGFERFAAHHRGSLQRVQKRLGPQACQEASGLLEAALEAHRRYDQVEAYHPFIAFILNRYYDPMYDYQLDRKPRRIAFRGDAPAVVEWIRQQA